MTRSTQDLLLDAAGRLCRARHWLDPGRADPERARDEAAKEVRITRAILEKVELDICREAAGREKAVWEGSR